MHASDVGIAQLPPRSSCDCLAALAHPSPRTVAFCLCSKSCAPASSNCVLPLALLHCRRGRRTTRGVVKALSECTGRRGAFNSHHAVEGAKRTTAVQVILHQNTTIPLFAHCKILIFSENSPLLTQKKLSYSIHCVYFHVKCHQTAINVPVAERERPVAR